MTATREEDYLLTPAEAMRQASDTAATYLARARRHVDATYPTIDKLAAIRPVPLPPQHPEIIAALIQAQALDYLAWVISARLTMTNDALENMGRTLEDAIKGIQWQISRS